MDGYAWAGADAYERYVGRWSRAVAVEFLRWLGLPRGLDWLDVGCGTGALTGSILSACDPGSVRGYDLSPPYVAAARERIRDARVELGVADARCLPEPDGTFHACVSGLAINFVPEPAEAVAEMRRVAVPGGTVAVYLWDYAEGMQLMRVFWDAAVELDPDAVALDEGRRFGLCRPEPLRALLESAGLEGVEVRAIVVPTPFADFDDYWTPFLGGQGPAPGYVASLDVARRAALRASVERRLPRQADGGIALTARAWAARGRSRGRGEGFLASPDA
jgi:SAM-dependent methyltransferase